MKRSSAAKDDFEESPDNDSPDQAGQYTESPDETLYESDQLSPDTDESDEELSPSEDEGDALDVDEYKLRHALLLHIRGQTYGDIAARFNKSERTVRRWVKKAREKRLVCVDSRRADPCRDSGYGSHRH